MMPKPEKKVETSGLVAAETAKHLERTQISKYHTPKGGHGFAAEDANTFADKIRLRKVEVTGPSNESNGPDRIVDGVKIQTKYCQTPKKTISEAFHADTGLYRYNGQVLEVPADQYDECVRIMEQKIRDGKIPGVTDPNQAKDLVKKGTITYQQARNIARAGNIDSLMFDAKTQAVTSGYMFAIPFVVCFARAKWDGKSNKEAASFALKTALAAGATTFVTGVVTAQMLRTRGATLGYVVMRSGVKKIYKTPVGKMAIEKIAKASLGKAVYGAAAYTHVAKLMRSNAITSTITTTVTTAPDVYRVVIAHSISWPQFGKNLAINASGVATGVGGWMGGAAIGTAFGPIGTVIGGLIGAIAGGTAGSTGAKFVTDKIVEDDAQKMIRIVQDVSEQLVFDYLLSEEEVNAFTEGLKIRVDSAWLRKMYKAGHKGERAKLCTQFAQEELEPICEAIIKKREHVRLPSPDTIQLEIEELIDGFELTSA